MWDGAMQWEAWEVIMWPVLANERPKKIAWRMDRHKDTRTDGQCDSMTDPAQRAESVKIIRRKFHILLLRFRAAPCKTRVGLRPVALNNELVWKSTHRKCRHLYMKSTKIMLTQNRVGGFYLKDHSYKICHNLTITCPFCSESSHRL